MSICKKVQIKTMVVTYEEICSYLEGEDLVKIAQCENFLKTIGWVDSGCLHLSADKNINLDKIKWIWDLNIKYNLQIDPAGHDNYCFRWAALYGYLDILKWLWSLKEDGANIDPDMKIAFERAFSEGHLEVLKWLWSLKQEFKAEFDLSTDNYSIFHRAAISGKKEILKWLLSLNICFDSVLYSRLIDIFDYGFEDIEQGWILRTLPEFDDSILARLMKCALTKKFFISLWICLNRKNICFGREMGEEISRKILLYMLPVIIQSQDVE